MRVNIKPLSVNDAWKGRRKRSNMYNAYRKHLTLLLKPMKINPESNLEIRIEYGFSSNGSDVDNPCKPFLDIISKKYGFNDNRVKRLIQDKKIVKKGSEYIDFEIIELEN